MAPPMPMMPPMGGGGMPPGMPPGMMPPPMGMPGGMGGDMGGMALDAMNDLGPKSANPTAALGQVADALDQMHELAMKTLPQVSQWNPKLAAAMHAIAKQILAAKLDLTSMQPLPPPPDLGLGMQGGMGTPPGMGPGMG